MNRRQFLAHAGMTALASRLLRYSQNVLAFGPLSDQQEQESSLNLWYEHSARSWNEALPVGNGRIGAMVFGRVDSERIQLNEATLWTGKPHAYPNPDARNNLEEIRRLIFNEEVEAAEKLAGSLLGSPSQLQAYQPFCDLNLDFYTDTHMEGYRRALDLRTAIVSVDYRCGDVLFRREAFVSYPDQVFVLHLSANKPGQQAFKLSMSSPHDHITVEAREEGSLLLSGQMLPHAPPVGSWISSWDGPGLRFAGHVQLMQTAGARTSCGNAIMVEGADEVTLLVCLGTSFVNYRDISGDPILQLKRQIEAASSRSYTDLKSRHTADHGALFHRVELHLEDAAPADRPTEVELSDTSLSVRPGLMSLFYQVGRYLLIAASRPGSQPANLQGIWNESLWPWWGSKWTSNINLQMNYWPAETGALPECVEPFYALLDDLRVTGREVARVHYGCDGFVFHHNADLWRAAAPADGSWGLWPVGGAWLALQTWEHYAFSLDTEFLRNTAYPALKESAEFMLSFLIEIPASRPFAGCLATNPTSSPENAFLLSTGIKGRLTYAATMDIEIIAELFDKCAFSARVLGVDSQFVEQVEAARKRLPPLQVSRNGELQEWIGDYRKTETEHRHLSPLYGLYPGNSITLEGTPAITAAARKCLELRGDADGPGGCFKAWRAALWARLGEGNHALRILTKLISQSTSPDMLNDAYDQVDGHLGGPAAIGEMLLQSQNGEIVLLPALPDTWRSGAVRGMKARGAVTVDFAWEDNSLESVVIQAKRSGKIRLRYKNLSAEILCTPNSAHSLDGKLRSKEHQ
jgi:alpha-L-fucosidase 2